MSNKKYIFLLDSNNLDIKVINDRILKPRGNWMGIEKNKIKSPTKTVDFFYINNSNSIFDKSHYEIKSGIKNFVDDNKYTVANKLHLYNNIYNLKDKRGKNGVNYVKQYNIDLYSEKNFDKYRKLFNNNKVWIFKPAGGWKGINIEIYNKFDDFISNINDIKIIWNKIWNDVLFDKTNGERIVYNIPKYMDLWVLQEYVDKPLLIHKHKFHVRLFYLYHKDDNGTKNIYISKKSLIRTALQPYKNADYDNKEIHDTHYIPNKGTKFFPDILYDICDNDEIYNIYTQIIDICKDITMLLDAGCYNETKRCFEIFGADLLITDNKDVVLMEFNSHTPLNDDNMDYFYDLIDGLFCEVIDMYYPPALEVKKNRFWLKI